MAFEELKARHGVVWGSGPYERISEHLAIAHRHLLSAIEARPGERWLDVATGTGELAVPAAKRGASVTGIDIAPRLIETARERARASGVGVTLEVGDAERLPYADAEFDIVVSAFGVMFTPTSTPRRPSWPASPAPVAGSRCSTGIPRAAWPSSR